MRLLCRLSADRISVESRGTKVSDTHRVKSLMAKCMASSRFGCWWYWTRTWWWWTTSIGERGDVDGGQHEDVVRVECSLRVSTSLVPAATFKASSDSRRLHLVSITRNLGRNQLHQGTVMVMRSDMSSVFDQSVSRHQQQPRVKR